MESLLAQQNDSANRRPVLLRHLFFRQAEAGPPASSSGGKRVSPLKAILAGGISGGIEICITYPTEYVKTMMQLYPEYGKKGVIHCTKETIKGHGALGLYRGLTSLLYFSIPKAAVRFATFEQGKNFLQGPNGEMTPLKNFEAGLFAGVCEAILVVTPTETIKVKLIHDQLSPNPRYKGFFQGVSTIAREQGLAGCYKGLFPTILKQGSNQAIRFLVFNLLKDAMLEKPGDKFTVAQSMFAGAVAGAASVFGNTPIDVIKTNMQGLHSTRFRNSWECVKHVWRTEGPLGFYKGTTPRLGRVCADVAIVMTLYEELKNVLDKIIPD